MFEKMQAENMESDANPTGGEMVMMLEPEDASTRGGRFVPRVPKTLEETGLTSVMVEDLVFKTMLSKGAMTGRELSNDLCLHFPMVSDLLLDLKGRLFVAQKNTAGMNDFMYILTDKGQDKAMNARDVSAYAGAAPVLYQEYLEAVAQQSIRNEKPGEAVLEDAFSDMIFDRTLFNTIGPAINSGRGLFLYGQPGNGKTSIAERLSKCFGDTIYIPKTLLIEGQIVQLYDPQNHVPVTHEGPAPLIAKHDQRWVEIKRPTVVVGGELTMEALEIKYNPLLKVSEAPLQLKANCGVFLIDDFGRQRVSHVDLLNRWIVPLEKRIDFLTLPNGQKVTVPFDELIIFSTNLDPAQLVDDAFLRRIPYKIHVQDPTAEHFKRIFQILAPKYGVPYDEAALDYLITTHYTGKRPFRGCQPRDILEQIVNMSVYRKEPPSMSRECLDLACQNYFAAMGQE